MKRVLIIALCALTVTMASSFPPAVPAQVDIEVYYTIGEHGSVVVMDGASKIATFKGTFNDGVTICANPSSMYPLAEPEENYMIGNLDSSYIAPLPGDPYGVHMYILYATFLPIP